MVSKTRLISYKFVTIKMFLIQCSVKASGHGLVQVVASLAISSSQCEHGSRVLFGVTKHHAGMIGAVVFL